MNFRLPKMSVLAFASIAILNAASAGPAAAGALPPFDFNAVGQNATSATISSYMSGVLGSTVTVYGATGERNGTTSPYTGDGHVIGPTISGTVYPLTLSNTENGVVDSYSGSPGFANSNDGYIKNCTPTDGTTGCSGASSDIFIDFGTLKIVAFSFDYEIFPDGTCADDTQSLCGGPKVQGTDGVWRYPNLPDLEIWVGGVANGDHTPGTNPLITYWGVAPATGSHSPASGTGSTETAPQALGHAYISIASGYTSTIDFMDWPETIGIDNLVIYTPEASSLALFGLGIFGLAMIARRKRSANKTEQG